MDAARTAKRLTGGSVTVVYRRSEREMPADEEEIEAIFAEGIYLEELASPTRIVLDDDGEVVALACIRNELGEPGPDGRRRPIPVEGSEFQLEADAVVVAIGQRPDVSFLGGGTVSLRDNKTIDADEETRRAGDDRVYAGGDAVRGPATIIEACADGRQAAEAICAQLGVAFEPPSVELPALSDEAIVGVKRARARKEAQHEPAMLPPEQRDGFDLVEMTLTEEQAQAEAARCLQCSHLCDKCVEVCPNRANYTYFVDPVTMNVPTLACDDGALQVVGEEAFRVAQTRQILHVEDFCNDCGNCTTFCIHHGEPYLDKPRLFLDEGDFAQADDNAFYLQKNGTRWTLRRREGGEESRLSLDEDGMMTFEDERVMLTVTPELAIEAMTLKRRFDGAFSLVGLAEMRLIFEGVVASLPFLPV
jgi:putative selenate reductase